MGIFYEIQGRNWNHLFFIREKIYISEYGSDLMDAWHVRFHASGRCY